MKRIAVVRTGTGGRWTYVVHPAIATTYAASIAGKLSRTVMAGVQPALTLQLLANGDVRAHATAARSFRGRTVELQRRMPPGGWSPLARRTLGRSSTALFGAGALPRGSLRLRLAMSVNQAGQGYLGGFGATLRYPPHAVSLRMSRLAITYGDSLTLFGRLMPTEARSSVTLLARPFQQAEFQPVGTIHATVTWQTHVRPPFTTSYQAQLGNAFSRVMTVGVRPAMSIRTLGGDRIWAHVGLAKSLTGRTVEMQRRTGRHWSTVGTATLDRKSSAVFTPQQLPGGTSRLRVTISVNQVGPGYLGGFSKPFVYHR